MNSLEAALALAAAGFHVFPLALDTKKPRWKGWIEDASMDPAAITRQWERDPSVGVGISTTRFGPVGVVGAGEEVSLLVIDLDPKHGPSAFAWMEWATANGLLPPTYTQFTPSGGLHLVYRTRTPVRCSVGSSGGIARGVDVKGYHGLIVGAGTTTEAGTYLSDLSLAPVEAPQQLIDLCGEKKLREVAEIVPAGPLPGIDLEAAYARGIAYMKALPVAPDGERNAHAYKAACHLRQLGIPNTEVFEILCVTFRSDPPLGEEELWDVTRKAFLYAEGSYGELAPERIFRPPVETPQAVKAEIDTGTRTPIDIFNDTWACVFAGSSVRFLREFTNEKGQQRIKLLNLNDFRAYNANQRYLDGNGDSVEIATAWLTSPNRRTYEGIVFHTGPDAAPPQFYNLWKGFANGFHGELPQIAHDAFGLFKQHSLENFCHNDKKLHWLHMAWYAHMVQTTWDKCQTAHVYRGGKGHGKGTFVDIIGMLCPAHYFKTARKRDIVGQFNAHLENVLLLVADEAFWAGDMEVHGQLQDLITESEHSIERKGCEQYRVDNRLRVVIMGNAMKLVKATLDERRYNVFDVADGWRNKPRRFEDMKKGMRAGGTKLLLDYFRDFDLTGYTTNLVMNTQGLIEQKLENLDPIHTWLMECLEQDRVLGGTFGPGWTTEVEREGFRRACLTWCREQGHLKYAPTAQSFGRRLHEVFGDCTAPSRWDPALKRSVNVYKLPERDRAQLAFRKLLGEES